MTGKLTWTKEVIKLKIINILQEDDFILELIKSIDSSSIKWKLIQSRFYKIFKNPYKTNLVIRDR